MTLTCFCRPCHLRYERGHYRCCAAPKNMASHHWFERWCREPIGEGRFCDSCPRCGCEHRKPQVLSGIGLEMSTLADIAPKNRGGLKALAKKEWAAYRDSREPGDDDAA